MGSEAKILHMIFFIILFVFCLNAHLFMAESSSINVGVVNSVEDHGVEEISTAGYNADGREAQIQKVSGEDETAEERAFVLEKFRVLLGLKSFNIISSRNSHLEHGSLAPSPAPSIESEAPAPAPVAHHHLQSHMPLPPRSHRHRAPPPHHVVRREHHEDKSRTRGIVVAVTVSSGVALLISGLGVFLVCWKFRKGRRRSARTMSVSGITDGYRGRPQYVNSPNSMNKVSLELGLYLSSLGSASEPNGSCLKHASIETVNKLPLDHNGKNSALDMGSDSDNDQMKTIHCSVHEVGEPLKYELDQRKVSLANEMVPIEICSSDDESFHSVCNSNSSIVRISNSSEGDLSEQSEILSPLNYSRRFLTPDHDHRATPSKVSYFRRSPKRSANRNLNPPRDSSLESSSQPLPCPPPPPPPPPPPAPSSYSSSSQSPFRSIRIRAKEPLSSAASDVSSPRDIASSSGSNQVLSGDSSSSANDKPPQASTSNSRNVPPPPCPPLPPLVPQSFVKGRINSLQPPPPPLGIPPAVGKDGAPLPKLKPLHWDKVRATPDRSMVWDKLKSNSFEFDEKMIESLFGYSLQNAIKNNEANSKSPSPSKHILEPKRLQNITILSKALNATPEQVCNALIQGNGLCLQQLEALAKMAPTKEEETMLLNFQGKMKELGSAERFLKEMLNVPYSFLRVEAMLYRDTFEDEVVHLRKSFAILEDACKELGSSRLFLKLLEAVLKTGNRMNVGTIRGGARAFKLDALLKLADVKGTDGKTTLLHFVVQEMIRSEGTKECDTTIKKSNQKNKNNTVEERGEDNQKMGLDHVSSLSAELCNVKKTATIDLDVLASSVSNLSEGMLKLQHLVHEALSIDDQKGSFANSMRSFLTYAEKSISKLKKDEDQVLLHVREITEYFHGTVSKDEANPLRIFVIVRDFLGMLDQVCKEIRSLKMPKIPNPLAPFQ